MTKISRRTHVRMDEMKVDLGREKLDGGSWEQRLQLKEDEWILREQLCTQGFFSSWVDGFSRSVGKPRWN
jgi:hypothetical protein